MSHELNTWIEDLIWCPSQIYYYFTSKSGCKYCIYLRWRHSDPWTAELVQCDDNWNMDYFNKWIELPLSRSYREQEYKDLERDVYNLVNKSVGIQGSAGINSFYKLIKTILGLMKKKSRH